MNLSDYSDTELPELSLTPEASPDPPQSLVFSRSPRPTKRRSTKAAGYDATLFSDNDEAPLKKKKKETSTALPLLIGLVVVVAAVAAGYYITARQGPGLPTIAPQCRDIPFQNMSMVECDRIFHQLQDSKQALDKMAGEVECGSREGDLHHPAPYSINERQLLFHWRELLNYTIFLRKGDLYIEISGEAELQDFSPTDTAFFYSTSTPHISWYCSVSLAVNKFAFYILTSAGLVVMAQIAHKVYQVGRYYITFCVKLAPSQSYYHINECILIYDLRRILNLRTNIISTPPPQWKRSKAKQETGQMYELIDQIIEELQRNYSKYQTDPINYVPYVAIPHARDRLLLPSERSAMKHIWERAVQFIAQHESRVRVEMRRVQSEDFPVWYWLEASRSPVPPQDGCPDTADFLYPDLDSQLSSEKESGSSGS